MKLQKFRKLINTLKQFEDCNVISTSTDGSFSLSSTNLERTRAFNAHLGDLEIVAENDFSFDPDLIVLRGLKNGEVKLCQSGEELFIMSELKAKTGLISALNIKIGAMKPNNDNILTREKMERLIDPEAKVFKVPQDLFATFISICNANHIDGIWISIDGQRIIIYPDGDSISPCVNASVGKDSNRILLKSDKIESRKNCFSTNLIYEITKNFTRVLDNLEIYLSDKSPLRLRYFNEDDDSFADFYIAPRDPTDEED